MLSLHVWKTSGASIVTFIKLRFLLPLHVHIIQQNDEYSNLWTQETFSLLYLFEQFDVKKQGFKACDHEIHKYFFSNSVQYSIEKNR